MNGPVPTITAAQLKQRVDAGDNLTVVDVREPWELQRASVHGAVSIPLQTLPQRVGELDRAQHYVIMCHHGMRSEMATQWLRGQGFTNVQNLDGGIDAWSRDVDPDIPQY